MRAPKRPQRFLFSQITMTKTCIQQIHSRIKLFRSLL